MTDIDVNKKLRAFFDAVVNVLRTKVVYFHDPGRRCFESSCKEGGICSKDPFTLGCNWRGILNLVTTFWEYGPDFNADWERLARRNGFRADDLHDLLLGVFIGGNSRQPEPPSQFQAYLALVSAVDALIDGRPIPQKTP